MIASADLLARNPRANISIQSAGINAKKEQIARLKDAGRRILWLLLLLRSKSIVDLVIFAVTLSAQRNTHLRGILVRMEVPVQILVAAVRTLKTIFVRQKKHCRRLS